MNSKIIIHKSVVIALSATAVLCVSVLLVVSAAADRAQSGQSQLLPLWNYGTVLLFSMVWLVRALRVSERHSSPVCITCGYPAELGTGRTVCPECGNVLGSEGSTGIDRELWPNRIKIASWLVTCILVLSVMIQLVFRSINL